MADLTFADAQRLDRLMLACGGSEWTAPLLLVTQPELCLVPGQCRRAEALTADGRTIPVHALASTPIRVLSSAPLMTPVADPEDAMSAHLADDEPFPVVTWTPWTGRDHPEDRDEQADYEPADVQGDEK